MKEMREEPCDFLKDKPERTVNAKALRWAQAEESKD